VTGSFPDETLDQPLPRSLWGALAAAEDALARLDERLRNSPIGDGFMSRTDFADACASLFLDGKLVTLEDLVLHDARMDIRSPTHELTLARAVLRARRRIAAAAPDWALSPQGLAALRGGDSQADEGEEGRGDGSEDNDSQAWLGAGPLAGELAALDRALAKSNQVLVGSEAAAKPLRDWFVYDPDGEEERLEAWRSAALASSSDPPCLAAALLWDVWEQDPPLERQAWVGNLLVPAFFRARLKTRSHLFTLSSALRLIPREKRRSPSRAARLAVFLEAVAAGAEAFMKDHDRLLLIRQSFESRLEKRRGNSKLPALVKFMMARPIASAGMIAAALGVTPRAAQDMVKELGLREMTGRGRYRAWGIL
jgi:Protein of unknown function (DUF1612)/HTH DNA binding domain